MHFKSLLGITLITLVTTPSIFAMKGFPKAFKAATTMLFHQHKLPSHMSGDFSAGASEFSRSNKENGFCKICPFVVAAFMTKKTTLTNRQYENFYSESKKFELADECKDCPFVIAINGLKGNVKSECVLTGKEDRNGLGYFW